MSECECECECEGEDHGDGDLCEDQEHERGQDVPDSLHGEHKRRPGASGFAITRLCGHSGSEGIHPPDAHPEDQPRNAERVQHHQRVAGRWESKRGQQRAANTQSHGESEGVGAAEAVSHVSHEDLAG